MWCMGYSTGKEMRITSWRQFTSSMFQYMPLPFPLFPLYDSATENIQYTFTMTIYVCKCWNLNHPNKHLLGVVCMNMISFSCVHYCMYTYDSWEWMLLPDYIRMILKYFPSLISIVIATFVLNIINFTLWQLQNKLLPFNLGR